MEGMLIVDHHTKHYYLPLLELSVLYLKPKDLSVLGWRHLKWKQFFNTSTNNCDQWGVNFLIKNYSHPKPFALADFPVGIPHILLACYRDLLHVAKHKRHVRSSQNVRIFTSETARAIQTQYINASWGSCKNHCWFRSPHVHFGWRSFNCQFFWVLCGKIFRVSNGSIYSLIPNSALSLSRSGSSLDILRLFRVNQPYYIYSSPTPYPSSDTSYPGFGNLEGQYKNEGASWTTGCCVWLVQPSWSRAVSKLYSEKFEPAAKLLKVW